MSFNLVTTETTYNDDGSQVIKDAITPSAFQNPFQILERPMRQVLVASPIPDE